MLKRLIYALAIGHLLLITIVISHVTDSIVKHSFLTTPLAFLCSLNYSVWQYGFFSPDVGKSTEVEIVLHHENGHLQRLSTLNGFKFNTSSQESANRFYGFKVETAHNPDYSDLCARSYSTALINRDPTVWKVNYIMRSIRYPGMTDYLNKKPVVTKEFYNTTFSLR